VNGVVFSGFGAHCDLFNYTGWVIGMSKTGQYLTGYVTMQSPEAPPQDGTWKGGGGAAGVWMAGSAIASDNPGRLFFSTGNGVGTMANSQVAASGRVHLDTLSECIVSLAVDPNTGALTQQDYFQPYNYGAMDAGDRDLGSGGVCLPDPATFSGGGISRLAITCGKNAKCYITNADNLGGFKMGAAGADAVIQTLTPGNGAAVGAIFSNVGTYPLEGGFLYISPVGSPTFIYSLGADSNGRPAFTQVAQTNESSPGSVSVGPALVTTLNGQAGTGILWITDTNGVRAYKAVPANGKMVRIPLPATQNAPSKFNRPTFGNGRYYMTSVNGYIYGFGSPVALPLNCTSPLEFGSLAIGLAVTRQLQCTANIPITNVKGLTIGNELYTAQNSSLPSGNLKVGDSFSLPITFNLTGYVLSGGSDSAPSVQPGVQTSAITLYTTNGQSGYSPQQSITLTGTCVSAAPWLTMSPLDVNFPGIVVGSANGGGGTSSTFIINNAGESEMKILGYAFSKENDGPYTNITFANGNYLLDGKGIFTSQDLLSVGSKVPAGNSVTIHATFNTTVVGTTSSIFTAFSNGGSAYVLLSGSANTSPVALLESSTTEGGWNQIPDCPIPAQGCTFQIDIGTASGPATMAQLIRFTNTGGSSLVITKSKPPIGTVLGAGNPSGDLSEGLQIAPGANAKATINFLPGSVPLNSDPVVYSGTWTLNTNDLTLGVHILNFTGTLSARRVGPLLDNGMARFKYLGCFQDSQGSRLEPTSVKLDSNSNGPCQQSALTADLPFAGTEYQKECWIGFGIPPVSQQAADSKCSTYTCSGDATQFCGGTGGYSSIYYDSTKFSLTDRTFINGYAPPSAPKAVSGYTYAGCYSDAPGQRILNGNGAVDAKTNSLENCATACQGYKYFGVEYATECYCGNSLQNNPTKQTDAQCSMICPGNAKQLCGAAKSLLTYSQNASNVAGGNATALSTPKSTNMPNIGNYTYLECRPDDIEDRALDDQYFPSKNMTIEYCARSCAGYTYFGLEHASECFCGDELNSKNEIVSDVKCGLRCAGNSNQLCGGDGTLSLYGLRDRAQK
jgi:hypothetical protein